MPKTTIVLSPCTSSQVREFGYDAATKKLAIRFTGKSGEKTVYEYDQVPAEIHAGLQAAESKGKYFGEHIKSKFGFAKVVDTDEPAGEAA